MDADRRRCRRVEGPTCRVSSASHPRSSAVICGFLSGLFLLATTGCHSAPAKKNPTPPPLLSAGEILRVNEAERLVVVRAAVLPEAGQEATVFGKEGVVGRIRFTSALRPPYMAADILEGRPQRGDHYRVEMPAATENRSTP